MTTRRIRVLLLSAALVGWKASIARRVPARWLVPLRAAASTALAAVTGTPLGLRPPAVWRGLRLGSVGATVVCAGVTIAAWVPAARDATAARELPAPVWSWLLVRIPLGTVWPEEVAFRGVLGGVAAEAFGRRWGRVVTATAFGLWHVPDARGAGSSVAGTVVVTGLAGWLFGWLCERTGSLAAPLLVHLATNEAGAVAAVLVRRGDRRHTSRACVVS